MDDDHSRYVHSWQKHIRVLAGVIGPRGATTEGERFASAYAKGFLAGLGYRPQVERFTSARSSYRLHMMAALVLLVAFAIYPLAGRASAGAATFLALLAIYSEIKEMLFQDNPLRRLMPKGASQNVFATLPPGGDGRQDVLLLGHIDSHRTPFIFGSARRTDWWRVFASLALFFLNILYPQ